MADTLLNYRGDAGLGLGANASIPVTTPKELDVINQTARDIYLTGVQRNQQLFQQKIKDRDELLKAIDSGDIKVGQLLEKDTPIVKEGLDNLDKAWAQRMKRGVNDIDAQLAYNKAKRDAQDRVTQAQARKVFFDQEQGALSKETLGRKQDARKKNLNDVIDGGFWKNLTPYQQTQDFDFDPINAYAKPVTTEFTDPKNPLIKGKKTIYDYNQVQGQAQKDFLENNDRREDQIGLLGSFQQLPPEKLAPAVDAIQKRLQEYNKQRGFIEGQPGYVELNVAKGPNGEVMINENVPDFAAKWALANQPNYVSQTSEFDSKLGAYKLGEDRNRIAQQNANSNSTRARTYAQLQQKKLSQLTNNEKLGLGIWGKVISKVKSTKTGGGEDLDVVFSGDLPSGYKNINGLDPKGLPIPLKPFKNARGQEYFTNKYYGDNGSEIDLKAQYNQYKASGGKGSYDELRSKLLKSGKINLEIKGANGSADINSALEAGRAYNNKIGAGSEPGVYQQETSLDDEEQ